ncbi:hypothetical protein BJ878DRAFT_500787 [Calycina marina]|uniref:Uncharacterized protein n=1 Tax=Calycina marina TaxID=1763456 RepID=A0A9P7Z640_9HELO|nr:hypothetical protein BJ878DRAFT_500787 [Calycina marina]
MLKTKRSYCWSPTCGICLFTFLPSSIIVTDAWAMLQDGSIYQDPPYSILIAISRKCFQPMVSCNDSLIVTLGLVEGKYHRVVSLWTINSADTMGQNLPSKISWLRECLDNSSDYTVNVHYSKAKDENSEYIKLEPLSNSGVTR